jgi:hypothetical protein
MMEALRDRILFGLGTDEPLIPVSSEERAAGLVVSMQWRKPLSFAEIARLAATPEVLARPGRP